MTTEQHNTSTASTADIDARLAALLDDAAGVPDQDLPEWMTRGLPVAHIEVAPGIMVEGVVTGSDLAAACPTVTALIGNAPAITFPAGDVEEVAP